MRMQRSRYDVDAGLREHLNTQSDQANKSKEEKTYASTTKVETKNNDAVIYHKMRQNLHFLPHDCILASMNGRTSVKPQVSTGTLHTELTKKPF